MSKLEASICGTVTEEELEDRFPSRAETFTAGYYAGSADTNLRVIKTLRAVLAILERNMAEDIAAFDGEGPSKPH
jgi:hypothetical protein